MLVAAVATLGLARMSVAEPAPGLYSEVPRAGGTPTPAASWFALAGPYDTTAPDALTTEFGSYVVQMTQDGSFNIVRQLPGGEWSGTGSSRPNGGDFPPPFTRFSSPVVLATPLDEPPPRVVVEVFGIGPDGAMYGKDFSLIGVSRSIWAPHGGGFISQPEAVRFGGMTYMFGVGLDGAVWYSSRFGAGGEWFSLGGTIVSDLTVTTDGRSVYVVGIGLDGAMWSRNSNGLTWSPWKSLGGGFRVVPSERVRGWSRLRVRDRTRPGRLVVVGRARGQLVAIGGRAGGDRPRRCGRCERWRQRVRRGLRRRDVATALDDSRIVAVDKSGRWLHLRTGGYQHTRLWCRTRRLAVRRHLLSGSGPTAESRVPLRVPGSPCAM